MQNKKNIVALRQLGQMLNKREIKMVHCAYVQSIFEIEYCHGWDLQDQVTAVIHDA